MFTHLLSVFLLFVSAAVADVNDCAAKCAKPNQEACTQGCLYAYALTLAPEDKALRPPCKKACLDNFNGAEEVACETGCKQFEEQGGDSDVLGVMSIVRRIMSNMFGSSEQVNKVGSGAESAPWTISRIRIFIPLDQSEGNELGDIPAGLPESIGQQHHSDQHMMTIHHRETRKECWFRHFMRAPYLVLFVMSLSTLTILFFIQLAVCLRRRHTVPSGYRYTPLPTYAEAINVKVPVIVDDEIKEPTKESDLKA